MASPVPRRRAVPALTPRVPAAGPQRLSGSGGGGRRRLRDGAPGTAGMDLRSRRPDWLPGSGLADSAPGPRPGRRPVLPVVPRRLTPHPRTTVQVSLPKPHPPRSSHPNPPGLGCSASHLFRGPAGGPDQGRHRPRFSPQPRSGPGGPGPTLNAHRKYPCQGRVAPGPPTSCKLPRTSMVRAGPPVAVHLPPDSQSPLGHRGRWLPTRLLSQLAAAAIELNIASANPTMQAGADSAPPNTVAFSRTCTAATLRLEHAAPMYTFPSSIAPPREVYQ